MIYLLFIMSFLVCIVLTVWRRYITYFPARRTKVYRPTPSCIRRTILRNFFRPAEPPEDDNAAKIKVGLLKGFTKFAVIFCVVALFYAVLQWWMESTAYAALPRATVLDIEKRIHWLQVQFKRFEVFKALPEVLLIALLIALASAWPVIERLKLKKHYERLMKTWGIVAGLLTIATSFTFFGSEIKDSEESTSAALSMHKLSIIKNNQLLVRQVEQKVKEEIIRQLLESDAIRQVTSAEESADSAVDSLLKTPDYIFYITHTKQEDPVVNKLIASLRPDMDPGSAAANYEQRFVERNTHFIKTHTSLNLSPLPRQSAYKAREFHAAIREQRYRAYINTGTIDEKALSESSVKTANNVFNVATADLSPIALTKYGDVGVKLLDNSYSLTAKGWIDNAASTLLDIPLLGEAIGPFHDFIKEYSRKKVKKVLAAIYNNNEGVIEMEFSCIKREINQLVTVINNRSGLAAKFKRKLASVRNTITRCATRIRARNNITIRDANRHLEAMKAASRWQRIRDAFASRSAREMLSDDPAAPFTKDQWRQFHATLSEWDRFTEDAKFEWRSNKVTAIEPLFFQYLKKNPKTCGAWGFILQQSDRDAAAHYYTALSPDKKATGKPYYLLKYYCNATGYGNVNDIYTDRVETEGNAVFCPRHE